MKIKKYLVNNMNDAIKAIKEDLGRDAMIVSSKRVRQKGLFGFFKPKLLEVTAAIDRGTAPLMVEHGSRDIFVKQDDFKNEIAEIKTILNQVTSVGKTSPKAFSWDEDLSRRKQDLLARGINEQLSDTLLNGINIEGHTPDLLSIGVLDQVKAKVYSLLTEIYCDSEKKKVLAFIGPTGVGKTTTIAKLAAQYTLFQHKKIGIITIDTYRIGAVEQLKTYGDILEVPVEVVMTPAELKESINRNQDKDVILIDTSGRSYKNAMQLGVLKGFLEKIPEAEVFLVLSCATKESDLIKNVESFGRLGFSRFIFTKTDETGTLGSILNLAIQMKVPVEYITNGQNVPDDIEIVNPEKLAGMVLGGELIEGPSSKLKRVSSASI